MSFPVGGSTRGGAVSVRGAHKENPREQSFNLDPGAGIYRPVDRKLSVSMGAGSISAELQTSSEFTRFNDNTKRCDGLVFKSKGTVVLPSDLSVTALGVVEDNIRMGFRVEKSMKLHLAARVLADLDIVEIELSGPQFSTPIRINDDFDRVLEIAKPGSYLLKGSYQLSVKLPNTGLGGRDIQIEMSATLTEV